jgi:uncharacterized protein (DUF2252 family)
MSAVHSRPRAERMAAGKDLRSQAPRASHRDWTPPPDRADPIDVLIASNEGRLEELVPIRFGRMLSSPFTFFRGAAAVMAADLAKTPSTGIRVQACGDCHLLNFGGFGTPERNFIFDINDFDETLPAPWEWDVKRLATSFVLAGRDNRYDEADCRESALAVVRAYRERLAELSEMTVLEGWYAKLDMQQMIAATADPEMREHRERRMKKIESRTAIDHDYPSLVEHVGEEPRIKDDPPYIYHVEESSSAEFQQVIDEALQGYRETLPYDRRTLFDKYHFVDLAIKVVGIGSVGTVCGVGLFLAEANDPLFLQVKQANASVLEPYAGASVYANHGQRVVVGQRLMQSASDIFLGWTTGRFGRHFYLRQLRDMKSKPMIEIYKPRHMLEYAGHCGHALAHAHGRSGDAAMLTGYLGAAENFDEALADFAVAYANQTEQDHVSLASAVRRGKIEAAAEPG